MKTFWAFRYRVEIFVEPLRVGNVEVADSVMEFLI
jgi:hypothetical protein